MNIDPRLFDTSSMCVTCGHLGTPKGDPCANPACSSHNPHLDDTARSQLDRIEEKLNRIETELAHLGSLLHE